MTQKYKKLSRCFFWLSWLIITTPMMVYLIRAFIIGAPHQKVSLGLTVVVAAILTGISVMNKVVIRSTKWILMLGIYFVLKEILILMLLVAIGNILDEFIFTPLHKKYKNKYIINKEIDKRG